jgi:hypothetical protein
MKTKKELSNMSLENLYEEMRRLNDSFFNAKVFFPTLVTAILIIFVATYVLIENYLFLLVAVILIVVYSFLSKFIYRSKIIKEIKSRQ